MTLLTSVATLFADDTLMQRISNLEKSLATLRSKSTSTIGVMHCYVKALVATAMYRGGKPARNAPAMCTLVIKNHAAQWKVMGALTRRSFAICLKALARWLANV